MAEQKRVALLIDCDNVSHNAIEGVLGELAAHGMVNVRHAHGDLIRATELFEVDMRGTAMFIRDARRQSS
ncbi:PIN domain-containing protein [Kineobactrum salinum]|uniref:hypothetical protein n=1 Tax=Kineobactrum salinum TaxID=2708301 RepID=UPI0018D5B442|nr:hypothetical protein [Kineobactrum salinum]